MMIGWKQLAETGSLSNRLPVLLWTIALGMVVVSAFVRHLRPSAAGFLA